MSDAMEELFTEMRARMRYLALFCFDDPTLSKDLPEIDRLSEGKYEPQTAMSIIQRMIQLSQQHVALFSKGVVHIRF
jgi:hypothetical protein